MLTPNKKELCLCTMPNENIKVGWWRDDLGEWENTLGTKTWCIVKAWESAAYKDGNDANRNNS